MQFLSSRDHMRPGLATLGDDQSQPNPVPYSALFIGARLLVVPQTLILLLMVDLV